MYTFDSMVRYSETDSKSNLTITGIVNYLQDCSTFQSDSLGIGIDYLVSHHLGWLITYWHIDIKRRPRLDEKIRIGTSPYAMKGFAGLRNFSIDTLDGERLVQADSYWVLMDLVNYVPVKVPEIFREKYVLYPKFDMEYFSRKMHVPEGEGIKADTVAVTTYDLDSNNHVNNACYVNWGIDALASKDKTFDPLQIKRLRVNFTKQVLLGDTITPYCFFEDKTPPADQMNNVSSQEDKSSTDKKRTAVLHKGDGEVCCIVEVC